MAEVAPDFEAIVVRSRAKVPANVLEKGKKLKVVGRAGVGVDNVDVPEATKRGVAVANALANQPGPNGSRAIVDVILAGTYSVNSDGTGTMSVTVTQPNGASSNVTEDFVITSAGLRNGILLATSIVDAQQQPSVILSAGNVFVSHTYSRRPD